MSKCILNRVKEIRWKKNLTVIELARRSGLRQSTITKVENGNMIPSQIVMMKISKGLGMPTNHVFKLDWSKVNLSSFKRKKNK